MRRSSALQAVCRANCTTLALHDTDSYHLEYGYSCMGYEIAAGLGVKMAHPEREVVVLVGDGSYLMLNSEISTSIALGVRMVVVVLNNRGFGCIERLQASLGGKAYNNLWQSSYPQPEAPAIDFARHAASLGAQSEKVESIAELDDCLGTCTGCGPDYRRCH